MKVLSWLTSVSLVTASEWGYIDTKTWAHDNELCSSIIRQSPINIVQQQSKKYNFEPFEFVDFDTPTSWNIINNGHTLKLSPTEKKVNMKVSGGGLMDTFTVGQMHLHWAKNDQAFGNGGSEHLLNSMRFWGELHVVCFNDKYTEDHLSQPDGLAVLGFFVDNRGAENEFFERLISRNEIQAGSVPIVLENFDLKSLMISGSKFHRYEGSLTTPPCSEAVIWTVFERPISISERQSENFNKMLLTVEENYRPAQFINGRQIRSSGL